MNAIGHALALAGSMTWEILWALILGFALSAVVQAVVRRSTVVRLLGDDRPRTLVVASLLGAASSSCSFGAVVVPQGRQLHRGNGLRDRLDEPGDRTTVLIVRFVRTGGIAMLRMMGGGPGDMQEHDHEQHGTHEHGGHHQRPKRHRTYQYSDTVSPVPSCAL